MECVIYLKNGKVNLDINHTRETVDDLVEKVNPDAWVVVRLGMEKRRDDYKKITEIYPEWRRFKAS